MTPEELAERGLRVRPLEWGASRWGATCAAVGAPYKARRDEGGAEWYIAFGGDVLRDNGGRTIWHPNLEAAKAAAEADYASRIAALVEGMG